MSALASVPVYVPTDLELLFGYLDSYGVGGTTAEAEVRTGNGEMLTIYAGGPGIHSSPAPPFATYEVVLDHEPARFWNRYTDDVGMLYAFVPRLLTAHHVTRRGGVREMHLRTSVRKVSRTMKVSLLLGDQDPALVVGALKGMPGVAVISSMCTEILAP